MKLKQQQKFIWDLLEYLPHPFRSKWIDDLTRAAIENRYIERWPDVMIADHQADEAIETAKRRKERPTRSDYSESEPESEAD